MRASRFLPSSGTGIAAHSPVIGARDIGSKLTEVVRTLSSIHRSGSKAVVFSLYPTTLSILARALTANEVTHTSSVGGVNKSVSEWRRGSSTALLLPVRLGGEGLTLVDASHVLIVDPLLDAGLDSQALNRVHRIGQSAATTLHRFVVRSTVEEVIHAERAERGAAVEAGEIDEGDGGELLKGDGGDGGFTGDVLRRMFGLL